MTFNPARWLSLEGNLSVGNWRWKNDVKANIYDQYSGLKIDEINVYSNGLPVGDAPQTQVGIIAGLKFRNGIMVMPTGPIMDVSMQILTLQNAKTLTTEPLRSGFLITIL